MLPNEIKSDTNFKDYDFVFLFPEQAKLLPENYFDLAQNYASMAEMRKEEIGYYFKIIQKSVKEGGYFYCCNRFKKNPENMGVGDNETREFFRYPWDPRNIDQLIDIDELKYEITNYSYPHLTVNRLQKIMK